MAAPAIVHAAHHLPVGVAVLPSQLPTLEVLRPPVEFTLDLAIRYTERLADEGAVTSIGSRGDSYDNALAESVNGLYKTDENVIVHRHAVIDECSVLDLDPVAERDTLIDERVATDDCVPSDPGAPVRSCARCQTAVPGPTPASASSSAVAWMRAEGSITMCRLLDGLRADDGGARVYGRSRPSPAGADGHRDIDHDSWRWFG